MAASVGNSEGDHGFQIAPMVDVVFVLLLFFMAVAAAKKHEIELPADLPVPRPPAESIQVPLVISISSEGRVSMHDFVYGQPGDKTLHALREKLTALTDPATNTIKDPVVIHPDNDARQERVMDVLNACSVAKVTKLTFN
jgi:biopolymer transport protein ExbD